MVVSPSFEKATINWELLEAHLWVRFGASEDLGDGILFSAVGGEKRDQTCDRIYVCIMCLRRFVYVLFTFNVSPKPNRNVLCACLAKRTFFVPTLDSIA